MISFEALLDNDPDRWPVSDLGFMRRRLLAIAAAARGAPAACNAGVEFIDEDNAG
jgi:hypothetical protein